jgi:hypothetical protein
MRHVARLGIFGLMLGLMTTSAWAADEKPAKLSPQFANYVRSYFEQMDKNKDGFLDREELAKALRGPRAKPVGDPPMRGLGKADDEGEPANESEKPNPQKPSTRGKPQKPTPTMPEDEFLKMWDSDGDIKISLHEFERWGEVFEKEMKQIQNYQQQMQRNWQQQMQNAMQRMWRRR